MAREHQVRAYRSSAVWAVILLLLLSASNLAAEEGETETSIQAYGDHLHPSAMFPNEALILRADHLVRAEPREDSPLDGGHRWGSASVETIAVEGDKVVSRLLERKIKDYFHSTRTSQWLKQKLLPEQDGSNFIKDVNYDLKLRADEFVIGVVYEF